jgi:hypothetical protein
MPPGRVLLALLFAFAASPAFGWVLVLELASGRPDQAQLFFDLGGGFSHRNSVWAAYDGHDEFEELRFAIPHQPVYGLRLDPGNGRAAYRLRDARLLDPQGDVVVQLQPRDFQPVQQLSVGSISVEEIALVPDGGPDPFVTIDGPWLERTRGAMARDRVSRASLTIGAAALLLLMAVVGGIAVREFVRWDGIGRDRLGLAVAGGVLGAMLFAGLRLSQLHEGVSWAPYLDQWDAEVLGLMLPLQTDTLTWSTMVAAHNEHRIVLTRVLSIAVALINGEWDNRVFAVIGVMLSAAAVAGVVAVTLHAFGGRGGAIVASLTLLPAAWSCDWENLFSGFQTQFHFLTLFSLLALGLLVARRGGAWTMTAGLVAVGLAVLSLGSGAITAVAALVVLVARRWAGVGRGGGDGVVLVVLVALVGAAWAMRVDFSAHAQLRPATLVAAVWAFFEYGGWPLPGGWVGFGCLWLPWAWLAVQVVTRQRRPSGFVLLVIGFGVWLLLQALALAWQRAGLLPQVSSRYTGILLWSGWVNAAAGLIILQGRPAARRWMVLGAAWVTLWVGSGFYQSYALYEPHRKQFVAQMRSQEVALREFMATDDEQRWATVPAAAIPYRYLPRLIRDLREPALQQVLPAPLRRDLARAQGPAAIAAVTPGPLTLGARALINAGRWIALAGAVGLLIFGWRQRRRGAEPKTPNSQRQITKAAGAAK